jgi:chemotaxis protein MotB
MNIENRVQLAEENEQLCKNDLKTQQNENLILNTKLINEVNKVNKLEKQIDYFKSTNTNLLDRLSDLSVVSKTGAESIKQSLEALNEQNRYIKDLTSSMQRKDSLNLVLVMNLKRALDDFDDDDINIEVKKGVVYVSISDRMLFKSGSYKISSRAEDVIGKIAKIINDHNELDILVEGHTDNVPIATDCISDNWDLSVKRATSIVRLMQTKFGVEPERMTAGGRAEYIPKSTNQTTEGRAINRRTEIVILPKLDQFFELLEPPKNNNLQ